MNVVSCEVVGCDNPARWVRGSQDRIELPVHVCTAHLLEARRESWTISASYAPLSGQALDEIAVVTLPASESNVGVCK